MGVKVFEIKSLFLQNFIMLFLLGVVLFLLYRAIFKRDKKFIVFMITWLCLVFWFFNSSFWGFSRIKINPKGVWLNYGILSIAKNIRLPLSSKWSLDTVYSGFPKKQKLYYIKIDGRKSMRVTVLGLKKLKKIGSNLQRYQQK